jgi:hypothetical protein
MSRCIASGISSYVPLFPPGAPVTVVVDGRFLAAYATAFVAGGRVFVPVDPLLTRLADRIYYEGNTLVVERSGRRIRVAMVPAPAGFNGAYVMAAPILHALGATVRYDARERVLFVQTRPGQVLISPTPFSGGVPSPPPAPVFTPEPVATPRPVWTGSPLPRRTPLPYFTQPPATAQPSR